MKYPIKIENIFRSSQHNYFTRKKYFPEEHLSESLDFVDLLSNRGIEGDRFEFSTYPITLFSLEVANKIALFHFGKSFRIDKELKLNPTENIEKRRLP